MPSMPWTKLGWGYFAASSVGEGQWPLVCCIPKHRELLLHSHFTTMEFMLDFRSVRAAACVMIVFKVVRSRTLEPH